MSNLSFSRDAKISFSSKKHYGLIVAEMSIFFFLRAKEFVEPPATSFSLSLLDKRNAAVDYSNSR